MNQITETIFLLKSFSQQVEEHSKKYPKHSKGFISINNFIIVCIKIFDSKDIRFSNNEEGIEAMKLIIRDFLYVPTMSVFEYNFLTIFPNDKAPLTSLEITTKGSRNTKFKDLINLLDKDNLIKNKPLWHFARCIRNDIAHFNSVARESLTSPDSDIRIFLDEDEIIKGEILSFVKLLQKLELDYYNLILGVEE